MDGFILLSASLGSKWRQNKRWIDRTIEGIPIYEGPISISAFIALIGCYVQFEPGTLFLFILSLVE